MSQANMFQDPITGRVVKIYLDQIHLNGHIYTALCNIVENGGGRVTSKQDSASIWIVNPDAPYALGEWKENVPVLFAPWLFACEAHGSLLGRNHGDWCGFKVPPQNGAASGSQFPAQATSLPNASITPKVKPPIAHLTPQSSLKEKEKAKSKPTLDFDQWTPKMTQSAMGYPKDSFPTADTADLSDMPVPPPSDQWGVMNAGGKRYYSAEEVSWMADVIEWALTKYPKMNARSIGKTMAMVAGHRNSENYSTYIVRHLLLFTERSPRFREHMRKHQAECDTDYLFNYQPSSPDMADSYKGPQAKARDTTKRPSPQERATPPWSYVTQTPFTDEDWDDFIRYAAARPNGMEPMGGQNATEIWKEFADKHPRHSFRSWRTWHQHRQDTLAQKVNEYRMGSV